MSTRAGCECIAHALQALSDADPEATILFLDGISAYDSISRVAMMRGLRHMDGGDALVPFVKKFYGSPSTYIWDDDEGVVHEVFQGEGGEQGDALMRALFSLEQHNSLEAIQARLRPSVELRMCLPPSKNNSRPWASRFTMARRSCGTAVVESQRGALTAAARRSDPDAIVWHHPPS